jgi:hypothetical protein
MGNGWLWRNPSCEPNRRAAIGSKHRLGESGILGSSSSGPPKRNAGFERGRGRRDLDRLAREVHASKMILLPTVSLLLYRFCMAF